MTVKERLHQLVEELPEEKWEAAERRLQELKPQAPVIDDRASTMEERRARIKAARGSAAHLPGSVDDFLRRKHDDIALEEAQSARRASRSS